MVSETYDVFISYSRADSRHAAEIDSILRAKGLRSFFDRRNLATGLSSVRALEQAISAAKATIVLIGPRGLKQYIAWRQACDAVMPSSQFATFLLCYVDGEAIEQEDDKCFGVARCHGFSDSMNDPTTHEKYSGDKAALKPLF